MQCLRPQKDKPGQEELVSKLTLEDEIKLSIKAVPFNGHGGVDDAQLPQVQLERAPAKGMSYTEALESRSEHLVDLNVASPATSQDDADEKPAHPQKAADEPCIGNGTMVESAADLAIESAVVSRAAALLKRTQSSAVSKPAEEPCTAISNDAGHILNEEAPRLQSDKLASGSAAAEDSKVALLVAAYNSAANGPAQVPLGASSSSLDGEVDMLQHDDTTSGSAAANERKEEQSARNTAAGGQEALHTASSNGSLYRLNGLHSLKQDDTASGSAAADERDDAESVSSDSSLDCTSTPIAIGQDPFAGPRHANAQHEKGPQFQYGESAQALIDEDSR